MKPTRIGVVINPVSGRHGRRPGEADRRRRVVERAITVAGHVADVRVTTGAGQGRALAAACIADGCALVIAMGGDGTVNEVAQALVGTDVPLAIVPCGSGDGLALGLGVPSNWHDALRVAMTGTPSRMDVGYANDRLFLNLAGIGFDAAVAHRFARRGTRGLVGYVQSTLSLVWTYRASHYVLQCGDQRREGRMFLLGIANAAVYGNGAVLSRDADVRDGLLDVAVVRAGSPLSQIWRARRLFWRHRAPADGVERLRAETVTVTGDHMVYHLDGEPCETSGTLAFRVAPLALDVITPA
ncbi:MAG: diacylglycerol kinase family lipid kinase [Acidobacteria bacterium]|nr:diacylglycerol kinase family lipid kinase [Acidobacteriota bacterium]